MSSEPSDMLINIIWSESDIESIVDQYNDDLDEGETPLSLEVGLDRAHEWARHIADTANSLIAEQLASVVIHDAP